MQMPLWYRRRKFKVQNTMRIAYKLLRVRKDGTVGSLFIDKKAVIPIGAWIKAGSFRTPGYAYRPGWHCTIKPFAPHLTLKGRVWYKVVIKNMTKYLRPRNQGGVWFLAQHVKLVAPLTDVQVQTALQKGVNVCSTAR
jgi:hypothetical protein